MGDVMRFSPCWTDATALGTCQEAERKLTEVLELLDQVGAHVPMIHVQHGLDVLRELMAS